MLTDEVELLPAARTFPGWTAAEGVPVGNAVELSPFPSGDGEASGAESVEAVVEEPTNPVELAVSAGTAALSLPSPDSRGLLVSTVLMPTDACSS